MKKTYILILAAILYTAIAYSQSNLLSLTYNTALPTGNTQNFINKYSWTGVGLEWQKLINENVSIGLSFSWQIYDQKIKNGVLNFPTANLDISGTQLRYFNYLPLTLSGHYYFNPQGKIIPFLGGGAGVYRVLQRYDVSGLIYDNNSSNFGFYPEIGLLIPLGDTGDLDVLFNSRYHYIFPISNGTSHSYLNLNLGLSFFY